MGFTLDKAMGTGSGTVRVTADANTSKEVRRGQILVQVKGVTKKIIQLTQKAIELDKYSPWIETDVSEIDASGDNTFVKYNFGLKLDGNKLLLSEWPSRPTLNISPGEVYEGGVSPQEDEYSLWNYHHVPENTSTNSRVITYSALFEGKTASAKVTQKGVKEYEPWLEVDNSTVPAEGGLLTFKLGIKDKSNGNKLSISDWPAVPIITMNPLLTTGEWSEMVNDGTDTKSITYQVPANDSTTVRMILFSANYNGLADSVSVDQYGKTVENVTVYINSDKVFIPGTGGDFTLHYGAVNSEGIKVTEGVELEVVDTSSNKFTYTKADEGIDDDGKWVKYTVPANTEDTLKTVTFKAIKGSASNTLDIRQLNAESIPLPEFDFFVFSFEWSEEAGKDLDSATFVEDTGIVVGTGTGIFNLDDVFVGYNGTTLSSVEEYLEWAGDNTTSGAEGSNIKWKNICRDLPLSNRIIKANIYANFFGSSFYAHGNGYMTLKVKTYKGTGMILNKENHRFDPDENTTLVSEKSLDLHCQAYSRDNVRKDPSDTELENVKKKYSHLCTIEYDVDSKSAAIIPESKPTGRSIREYCTMTIDGTEEKVDFLHFGEAKSSTKSLEAGGGKLNVSFEDVKEEVYDGEEFTSTNATECTVVVTKDDNITDEVGVNNTSGFNYELTIPELPDNVTSRKYIVEFQFTPTIRNLNCYTKDIIINQEKSQ